jgi:polyisoprenoid-binding protein YceI
MLIVGSLVLVGCVPAQSQAVVPTVVAQKENNPTVMPTAVQEATQLSVNPTEAKVDPAAEGQALVFTVVTEKSQANYRLTEQLANRDLPNDAVGVTKQISGMIVYKADGTIDSAQSKITVDLTDLKSDANMRDNYVRRNILQIDQYPSVVFVPTSVEGLSWPLPESGQVSFVVKGNLTIRDVTKPVQWDVTGEIANGEATGQARTEFQFADFNLTQPSVPIVLSLEDKIILEATIVMSPKK